MTTDTQLAPTDDEIDALWALLSSAAVASPSKFAREVLARWGQPAHSGEPVAWAFKYDDGTWHDPSTTEHSSGMRPLFDAPQPVEREPLTPERVKEIVLGAGYDQCGIPDTERAAFINGMRHGEHAHGITKGGQHGTDT